MQKTVKMRFSLQYFVVSAMLCAASIALRPLTVYIGGDTLRVSFMIIPIAVAGMVAGAPYAAAAGAAADVLSFFLFPSPGAFFPGFTLTAALEGAFCGLMLYEKPYSVLRSVLTCVLISLPLHIFLNTYWLHLLAGVPMIPGMWAKLVKELILLPFYSGIFYFVSRFAVPKMKKIMQK